MTKDIAIDTLAEKSVGKSHTLPDGTVVELAWGDAYSGPEDRSVGKSHSKLHVNTNATFYRINGGEWQRSPERAMHKTVQILQCCENLADLRELMRL